MTDQEFDRILFKPEMVRAILAGRKWQTRRVLKPQPELTGPFEDTSLDIWRYLWIYHSKRKDEPAVSWGKGESPPNELLDHMRFPRDLLGVCESWRVLRTYPPNTVEIVYSSDETERAVTFSADRFQELRVLHSAVNKPSIFMPDEAIRLFLRVERRWCERVQDIDEEDALAEGVPDSHVITRFESLWDSINAEPKPVKQGGEIVRYESYPWKDVHETWEHRGKPWHVYGNPWVECYAFEIDRETDM